MNTKKIALYFFITIFYIFCVFFIFSISFINIKNKTIRLAIEKHQINSTKLIVEKIYEDLLFDNLIEANRKLNLLKQENIIRDFIILKNNQYLNDDSSYCENIFFDKKNHSALWGKVCLKFPTEKDENSYINLNDLNILFIIINCFIFFIIISFFRKIHKINSDLFTGVEKILLSDDTYQIELSFWNPILIELKKLVQKNSANENKLMLNKIENEKIEIALTVAHDIRSPLAALENIDLSTLKNEQEQKIAKSSIYQLKEIANSLLEKGRGSKHSELSIVSLFLTINNLKDTKSVEFPKRKINIIGLQESFYVSVNPVVFENVLSNLINNAIEASNEETPILIELKSDKNFILLKITDRGNGIPEEILSRLGNEKITFGKNDGNGFGVYNASQNIKNWGGKFEIQTTKNIGTTILITLPQIKKSESNILHVLLDNDELIRLTWESKAKKCGINLTTFSNSSALLASLSKFPKDTFFYIDSVLDNEKGEDFALSLFNSGYENLYMCSGYSEEKFSHLTFIKKVIGKNPPFTS